MRHWIVAKKYEIIIVILAVLLLISARGCVQYRGNWNMIYDEIEHRNERTLSQIASSFRYANHDFLVKQLAELNAYSHMSRRMHEHMRAPSKQWDGFLDMLIRFDDEELFNFLTQEQRLYIADAILELLGDWPVPYEVFYDKLIIYIVAITHEFHGIVE